MSRFNPVPTTYPPFWRDKIVCIGDSLLVNPATDDNWPLWLKYMTGLPVINKGTAGNTAADVLARIAADCTALTPGMAIILVGTNDVGGAVAAATTTANMTSITNALIAANVFPIWCTIPPRADNAAYLPTIRSLNHWIVAHAKTQGLGLIDLYTLLSNSDGTMNTAYFQVDNLHPNDAGAYKIAEYIFSLMPKVPRTVPWKYNGDAENLIANATFTDSNADGLPDSWSKYGSSANYTTSIEGEWLVVTKSSNDAVTKTATAYHTLAPAPTIGATYRFEFECLFTNLDADVPSFRPYVNCTGAATPETYFIETPHNITSPLKFTMDLTIPADTTAVYLSLGGTSTGRFIAKMRHPYCFLLPSAP